jgi:hypothetical protein
MDAIREQLNRPLVAGIVGLVVGAIFGLVVLGWWLWPVKYSGAGPKDLRYDQKVEYLRMAIEAFGQTKDVAEARSRYEALGPDADQVLQDVASSSPGLSPDLVQSFGASVLAAAPPVSPSLPAPGAQVTATAGGTQAGGFLRSLLPVLCLVVLLLAAVLIVVFILRGRSAPVRTGEPTPAMQAQQAARQAAWTDYTATGAEPPMAQFMASYKLGDDLFDDSFSIDSPAGEFMGECGVGISETIGVGDPKKVTAFEVWLFDKNDIQTVTKVLMSSHAFEDDATRQRLAAKGEPLLAEPGTETVLETQTLQLVARVVDMGYGDGALPAESFFDRFILELAVWPKS